MSRLDPSRPIRCVVTINLSHSADATLRKSEISRVGMIGSSHYVDFQLPQTIVCSVCSVIL